MKPIILPVIAKENKRGAAYVEIKRTFKILSKGGPMIVPLD